MDGSHDVRHFVHVVQVLPADCSLLGLGVGQLLQEELVGVELIRNLLLDLQFLVVVPVLVFEAVFGVDLDGVLILLRLHRDDIVALLLFLVDLFIRDVAVE